MGLFDSFLLVVGKKSAHCRSEAELRHLFLTELEQVCKEEHIPVIIRMEESLASGRDDARIGRIVYEFKKPYKLDSPGTRKEALAEIFRYLSDLAETGGQAPERLMGFITDGRQAAIVTYSSNLRRFTTVDVFERVVPESSAFKGLEGTSAWFERVHMGLGRRELTPENLLSDLGPGTSICEGMVRALWESLQTHHAERRVRRFYEQWKILFSLATESLVSGSELAKDVQRYGLNPLALRTEEDTRQFLYVIHTYYSLILKLIAIRVVDDLRLLLPTVLLKRIVESPFRALQEAEESLPRYAANLVERDVFSWFPEGSKDVEASIREMAVRIGLYDVEGVRRDVLKRVYQTIIPTTLRKALGEFYTKDWTAELVLDSIGYDGSGSILDPSCGSGTFLALAIQRRKLALTDHKPEAVLSTILGSVVGFDINPIAVTTARLNYLLSVLDLLKASRLEQGLQIPIYLCDSVVLPQEKFDFTVGGERVFVLGTAVGEVRVPFPKGGQARAEMLLLKLVEEFKDRPTEDFFDSVRQHFGDEYLTTYQPVLRGLHDLIVQLEAEGINGIWAGMFRNFFAPLFVGPFDYVVGNPPWVAPINVPKEYRDRVHTVVDQSGFLEPYDVDFNVAKASFPGAEEQYTSCLPFFSLALRRYVRPGGKCAFLVTSSLIRLLNAGGWRRRMLEYGLTGILDLTQVVEVHEGAPYWSFVPVVLNSRDSGPESVHYRFALRPSKPPVQARLKRDPEAAPALTFNEWTVPKTELSIDRDDARSPWFVGPAEAVNLWRRMQRFPRMGDQYPINMGLKASLNDIYMLRAVRTSGKYIQGKNLLDEPVVVEREVVFPVCKGKQVKAWNFDHTHMLLPHQPGDWAPIPTERLSSRYPEALAYFERHREALLHRTDYSPKKGPFYMIFRLSADKVSSFRVAYADISPTLHATVVPPSIVDEHLGSEARPLLVDNSAYFVTTKRRDEAYYVAGLLNSTTCRSFAQGLARPKHDPNYVGFKQWMIGTIPAPPFDPADPGHRDLVDASRKQHQTRGPGETAELVDRIVADLYGFSSNDARRLSEALLVLHGGVAGVTY